MATNAEQRKYCFGPPKEIKETQSSQAGGGVWLVMMQSVEAQSYKADMQLNDENALRK